MPKSSAFYSESSFSVDNNFTDISLLHKSENGYSEVYKAQRYGKWHILKRLTDNEKDNPRYQQLLKKEFDISYQLSHPGIVHTLGMEDIEGLGVCIIQEYIDGVTWDEFYSNQKIKQSEDIRILSELCLAIDYIHQRQIVHRDITPKNVLITRDGHHPVLIDFGLADKDNFIYLKEPAGTTGYASPEQQKPGILDNRSDIYSLGILIDEYISGWKFRRIANKCKQNNPRDRFISAEEIRQQLKPGEWNKVLTGILFFILIVVVSLWFYNYQEQQEQISNLQREGLAIRQQSKVLHKESACIKAEANKIRRVSVKMKERFNKEDEFNKNLKSARLEMRMIAKQRYQLLEKKYSDVDNSHHLRELTVQNAMYSIKVEPIIASVRKKFHIDSDNTPIDIEKELRDEWLKALYDKI